MKIYKISLEEREMREIFNKEQRLQKLIKFMDVPSRRFKDYRWLMRNLRIRNSLNPNFDEAISIIRELIRDIADPLTQEGYDAWLKIFHKQELPPNDFNGTVYCAWCKKLLKGKDSDYNKASHGICDDCTKKHFNDLA